jgi:hypothetical protein
VWDTSNTRVCGLRALFRIRSLPIGHVLSLATAEAPGKGAGGEGGLERLLLGSQDANVRVVDVDLRYNNRVGLFCMY